MRSSGRLLLLHVAVLALAVLGGIACGPTSHSGKRGATEPTPPNRDALGSGWTRLPDPPFESRMNPVVGFVHGRIIVTGGWNALCPPNADCVAPSDPPLSDGGAYDLATGRWSRIADAPVGFGPAASAVIGSDLYVLVCDPGRGCPADHSMLRYRSRADAWEALSSPGDDTHRELMVFERRLIAYAPSDEGGEVADQMLTPGEDHWVPLPDDPLPAVYDRQLVEHDGRLLVFGSPIESDHATKLGAAFDPTTNRWTRLQGSGTLGYQVWRSGSLLYLNPHFGPGAEGGVYDPAADAWTPLPGPPAAKSWHNDMAGVLSADDATYAYPHGWALDTDAGRWIEIPPRPTILAEPTGETVHAAGTRLVVAGGQSWSGDTGRLVDETWVWTPPRPASVTRLP